MGRPGRLFGVFNGMTDLTIEHNTAGETVLSALLVASGLPNPEFVFRYNIARKGTYGVLGSGKGDGLSSLTYYFPGYVFDRNVIAGVPAAQYPPGNFYPATLDAGFTDPEAGNYALLPTSPYKALAPGPSDLGVNMTTLLAAMAAPFVPAALEPLRDRGAGEGRRDQCPQRAEWPRHEFPEGRATAAPGEAGHHRGRPESRRSGWRPVGEVNYDTGTDGWSSTLYLDVVP